MNQTREKILQTALRLFARDGYEGVSVSAIAGELGITKGALYRHYKSKRDIFESILARMEQEDARRAESFQLPTAPAAEMADAYRRASVRSLLEYCSAQFRYWTEDSFASAFRKMLTLEQHRSPEMGQLFQQYLAAGPMGYTADLLTAWGMEHPREQAAQLYGAMFLLYSVYDGAEAPETVHPLLEEILRRTAEQWL